MLGLLGLRIFEATSADIADLGEEHGHRVLRVCGKGSKVVLVPLPPSAGRAIGRAVSARLAGPILRNSCGARMDRHAATRRLRRLAEDAGVRITRSPGVRPALKRDRRHRYEFPRSDCTMASPALGMSGRSKHRTTYSACRQIPSPRPSRPTRIRRLSARATAVPA
jgi:hypothetical protein